MVEVAVDVRRRRVEDIHLHAARRAVGGGGKVRVVRARAVLRIGQHRVVAEPAASEVVRLEVARRLGEAELVEAVVDEIAPVEEVRDRGVPVGAWRLREVHREVEHAARRALRARQIRHVVRVRVRVRIDVVPHGFVDAVVDPPIRRSRSIQRRRGDERARDGRGLRAQRRGVAGGKRRGTVARINAVAGIRDVVREPVAQQRLARLRVDEHLEHLAARLAHELHLPAQPQRLVIHRQPDVERAHVEHARGAKALLPLRPGSRIRGEDLRRRDLLADILRRERDRLRRADGRCREPCAATGRALRRRLPEIGHKLARYIHQLAARRRVCLHHRLEDLDAVEFLIPHRRAQLTVRVVAPRPRARERLRAVAEERAIPLQESLHRAMLVILRDARCHARGGSAAFTPRPCQEAARRADELRCRAPLRLIHAHARHTHFQIRSRLLALELPPRRLRHRRLLPPVEIMQRLTLRWLDRQRSRTKKHRQHNSYTHQPGGDSHKTNLTLLGNCRRTLAGTNPRTRQISQPRGSLQKSGRLTRLFHAL